MIMNSPNETAVSVHHLRFSAAKSRAFIEPRSSQLQRHDDDVESMSVTQLLWPSQPMLPFRRMRALEIRRQPKRAVKAYACADASALTAGECSLPTRKEPVVVQRDGGDRIVAADLTLDELAQLHYFPMLDGLAAARRRSERGVALYRDSRRVKIGRASCRERAQRR